MEDQAEDFIEWIEDRMTEEEREDFSAAFQEQLEAHEEVLVSFTAEEIKVIGYRGAGGIVQCK